MYIQKNILKSWSCVDSVKKNNLSLGSTSISSPNFKTNRFIMQKSRFPYSSRSARTTCKAFLVIFLPVLVIFFRGTTGINAVKHLFLISLPLSTICQIY